MHAEAMDATAPAEQAPEAGTELPTPIYSSWEDYLARTTERERLEWCRVKAKTASRERLMSGRPERRITAQDVWQVAEDAQGQCTYCGSLALDGGQQNTPGTRHAP